MVRLTTERKHKMRSQNCAEEKETDNLSIKVGTRVEVYWENEDAYYEGIVASIKREGSVDKLYVQYYDGDEEWVDQEQTEVRVVLKNRSRNVKKCLRVKNLKVGSKLLVWWPSVEKFYHATLSKVMTVSKEPHFLKYDDGDEEWTDLMHRKFKEVSAISGPEKQVDANACRSSVDDMDGNDLESDVSDRTMDKHTAKGTPSTPPLKSLPIKKRKRSKNIIQGKKKKRLEIP